MNVSLTPQLESMIRERVDSGRYNNASEVVRQALRLLEAQDLTVAYLRARNVEGIDQIEREGPEAIDDAYWKVMDQEVYERIASGDTPDPDVSP